MERMEGDDDGGREGIDCADCGEVISWEHLDMCDEKGGGEVYCPHCGEFQD